MIQWEVAMRTKLREELYQWLFKSKLQIEKKVFAVGVVNSNNTLSVKVFWHTIHKLVSEVFKKFFFTSPNGALRYNTKVAL